MKITDVEAIYLSLPAIQQRTDSSQDALLIKVTTDGGIVGWGEVDGSPLVARITSDDKDVRMPPEGEPRPSGDEGRRWIKTRRAPGYITQIKGTPTDYANGK